MDDEMISFAETTSKSASTSFPAANLCQALTLFFCGPSFGPFDARSGF